MTAEKLYSIVVKTIDNVIDDIRIFELNADAHSFLDEDFFDFVRRYSSKQNSTENVLDVYAMGKNTADIEYTDGKTSQCFHVHWQIYQSPIYEISTKSKDQAIT